MATIKVEHNAIYWASIALTVLFAWVIFPYKWIVRAAFNRKKAKAFKKARRMSKDTGAMIYVVQWSDTFFVGKRNELRQIINQYYAKRVRQRLNKKMDTRKLNINFRNAIIARFQRGEQITNEQK